MANSHFRTRAAAALLALLAVSCSTSTQSSSSKQDAAVHSLRSDQLESVMRGFDESVRKKVPDQVDVHDRWEGTFAKIADAAQSLKQSAIALSGHPPGKLEIPDRARFAVLARSLADRAGELEEAAARDDADAVEISRKRLGAACRDCHSRFRPDSPGVPDAFR